ncbi:DUF418 domain-containing protein [Nocardia sp. NPDC052112]|uniref:DUF418 domain-containing protein n=1 Tax=Nocardia sp. NPDC052112 TaxID=3155646 RepID=UPI00344A325D
MTDQLVASRSRVHDVDALRGFALSGIFIVNITFMASGYPGNLAIDPAYVSILDDVVRGLSEVFVDMKFYLLFSFLFGYSFTLQMESAAAARAAFEPRMLRRIGGLFVIGVLHSVFLYAGDVLTTYAVACLVLFWMRRVGDRTALRVAAILYGLVVASLLLGAVFMDVSALLPSSTEAQANAERATQAMLGSWGDVIGVHLDSLGLLVLQSLTLQGPTALAMLLLGMVAGRRRSLADVHRDEPILRRIQLVGFPIGLAGSVLFAIGGGVGHILAVAVSLATAPFLSAAYIATLLRAMHSPRTSFIRTALAPAGRIALTNYLTQSAIGLLIFTGIGLGAAGTFSPLATVSTALIVFTLQLALSAIWLRWFRYGPAEWILRWITNAHRPAWRTALPTTALASDESMKAARISRWRDKGRTSS